jgi:hypothetical protein
MCYIVTFFCTPLLIMFHHAHWHKMHDIDGSNYVMV